VSTEDSIYDKIFYGSGFGRGMSALRAGYLLVVWLLVPGFFVMLYYRTIVGLIFTAALAGFGNRIDADVGFRHPFFTWTGDIGVEDLRIHMRNPDPAFPLSVDAKRLRLDLPNLGVMQQAMWTSAGDSDEQTENRLLGVVNQLDHIGVHLEGLKYDGFSVMPGLLDYVGLSSAAPLETEGCVGDTMWLASEMSKLGIVNQGVDLQLTLANATEQHEVHVIGKIDSPSSSHAAFEQHYATPGMVAFLEAEKGSRVANYERLEITDEGFIRARDAYCAKRDGVVPEEFRERHLASVRRLMQEGGMRPTEEVESVYRQYLQNGKLVLEARPNPKVRLEDYHHYSIADQAMMFNATISSGGKAVPVRFDAVPERAIPLEFEGSTWDLVASETRPRAEGDAELATPATVAAPAVAAAAPAPVAPAPAVVAPKPALAQASAVPAPAPAAKAPAKVEKAPDWAVAHNTTRLTADGKPLASSLPQKGAQRARNQPLAFEELSSHVGDRIIVTTIYGDRHEGKIEQVVGTTLRLRSAPGMGSAITNFERAKVRSITRLD
jgi:hypothetical protein